MKSYRNELLAFIRTFEKADAGQMTLSRLGPDTYPDPAKMSWNDMVSWRVELTFGRGYFTGAVVRYVGEWRVPHSTGNPNNYAYAETEQEFLLEEAVDIFLSDAIPDWVTK